MPEVTNILMALPAKPHHRELLESCAPNAKFTYKPANEVSDEELAAYDAILGVVPPARMNKAKSLKFVQLSSAGSDAYMAPGVLPEGAVIANATGSYGLAISEYLMGVLLSLSKRLHQYRDRQPQGVWGIIGEVKPVMGSTVLVVGIFVLLLDLASAPGGFDHDWAKQHGYHVIWALSLPGKTAPVTAGRIISDSIRYMLNEEVSP